MLARCDASFTAFFKDLAGIDAPDGSEDLFTLTPNPATGRTLLTIARPGQRMS